MAYVEEYQPGRFRGVALHPRTKKRESRSRFPAEDGGRSFTDSEAKEWAVARERELTEVVDRFGNEYTTYRRRAKGAPTLDEYLGTWLRAARRKPSTQAAYERAATMIRTLGIAACKLPEIKRGDVEAALVEAFDIHEWADTKVERLLQMLRVVLRHAEKAEQRTGDPTFGVSVSRTSLPREWCLITGGEALALAAQMPDRLAPMVLVAYDAGLRLGEVAGLTATSVDLRRNRLHVGASVYSGEFRQMTKGKTRRTVPIKARLREALTEHMGTYGRDGLLFPTPTGAPLTNGGFYPGWHKARAAAGFPALRFHDLRHAFCTNLAQRGAPVRQIQQWAGHGSESTTMRYIHYVEATDGGLQWIEDDEIIEEVAA